VERTPDEEVDEEDDVVDDVDDLDDDDGIPNINLLYMNES
jgi:hypothetical protein